eukprot:11734223-Heterocapsa_arctica.AAC.1
MARWAALLCAEFEPDACPVPKISPPASMNIWVFMPGRLLSAIRLDAACIFCSVSAMYVAWSERFPVRAMTSVE